eukprot:s2350_g8.t1
MHGLQILLIAGLVGPVAGQVTCLPNATDELDRKELVNLVAGESYSIGLWRNGDYPAARLTHRVERLGYKVALKGTGALTQDAFFALMGCTRPLNSADRGCGPSLTYVHINVEAWTDLYAETWAQVQAEFPNKAPKNLGNMGYLGSQEMYVPFAVQQKAYEAEGINLDFYRDYNRSWRNPAAYFAVPSDLNVSLLLPCEDTALMSTELMSNYLAITGDSDGVVVDNLGVVVGKCFDGYFWYAPACRANPGTCLTWFTGGNGWGIMEMPIKAAVYNMPVATAVASSWENYVNLPADFNFMLYWWVPDPTFLRLKPNRVTFPEHDREAYATGDVRSAAKDISVDKFVSRDLSDLAPEVLEFMNRFQVSLKAVNEMMLNQLDTNDDDFDVACRWLLSNEDRWNAWLPEKGKCFSQFGMYSEEKEKFLQTREAISITCRACPSGSYSAQLEDSQGWVHQHRHGDALECIPCGEGLDCPFSSSIETLQTGQPSSGEQLVSCTHQVSGPPAPLPARQG